MNEKTSIVDSILKPGRVYVTCLLVRMSVSQSVGASDREDRHLAAGWITSKRCESHTLEITLPSSDVDKKVLAVRTQLTRVNMTPEVISLSLPVTRVSCTTLSLSLLLSFLQVHIHSL